MISQQEKQRALMAERWSRRNYYYAGCGITLLVIQSLIVFCNRTAIGILQAWKNGPFPAVFHVVELAAMVMLLQGVHARVKKIETTAQNWPETIALGRGVMMFTKWLLNIAMVLWGLDMLDIFIVLLRHH